jgi:polar amino acid transport system substrate-binding protein
MRKLHRGTRVIALVAVAASATALSACSSSGGSTGSGGSSVTGSSAAGSPAASSGGSGGLNSQLPSNLQKGTIDVAAVSDYPPLSYSKAGSTTIEGFDIDLLNSAAQLLGVKFNFKDTSYDSLIPSLQAGREAIAEGGAEDTTENEKVTTMIDYLSVGAQIAVPAGNPKGIHDKTGLCGKTVAVLAGSPDYLKALNGFSNDCKASGKPALNIATFKTADQALLALNAGRADAEFDASVLQAYRVKQGVKIESVGPVYIPANIGITVPAGQMQLAKAIKAAIQQLMDNGTYKSLLAKWNLDAGAIKSALINSPAAGV